MIQLNPFDSDFSLGEITDLGLNIVTFGGYGASQAAEAQNEANRVAQETARRNEEVRQRIADVQAQRERRQAIRNARIARAQNLSAAATAGVSGGTAVAGTLGNIATGTAGELGTSLGLQTLSQETSAFNIAQSIRAQGYADEAAYHQGMSALGQGIAQAGTSIYRMG